MNRVGMIVTVGIGGKDPDSLLNALKKSIEDARPDLLALVFSAPSRTMADKLKTLLSDSMQYIDFQISDENDLDKTFSELVDLIDSLEQKHECPRNQIKIDFTSGTKAMSAAAALAAVAAGVDKFRYIAGERKNGTVVAGLEKIITFNPTRILVFHHFTQAVSHLRNLRFSAANSILDNLPKNALPESHREAVSQLQDLTNAYQAWDLFQHRQAGNHFRNISTYHPFLQEFQIQRELIGILFGLADSLTPEKNHPSSFSQESLADLYNNAHRRIVEGKYDDACARLYRLTEMCAQFVLESKFQINTGRLREEQVPAPYRSDFNFKSNDNPKNKTTKISLQDDYKLLKLLDHDLGKQFEELHELHKILKIRNHSILAHGVKPVEEQTCKDFRQHVRNLIGTVVPDFDELTQKLQFPWLRG